MSSNTATFPQSFLDRLQSRLSGLAVLGAALALIAWLGVQFARAFTDAWVAPILLSPDNDAVLQLRLSLNRQVAELERAEAEISRIDEELVAVSAGIARLSSLRHHARQTLTWQAGAHGEEQRAIGKALEALGEQRLILERLLERQERLTERTREDLRAGLTDRTELEKQEQALDTLRVQLVENRRLQGEASLKESQLARGSKALRNAFAGPSDRAGRMPEVAAGEEHEARLEVELVKLEGEQRGLKELRRVAGTAVEKQRELLDELRTRPLYRAMKESTQVAFVPYSQIEGVEAGNRVFSCVWGLFRCQEVGVVTEVVSGEVVTPDPWGTLARGQYAVLKLSVAEAIQEKVLRIRRS